MYRRMRARADHRGSALRWGRIYGKGKIMRKQYIRWILPIIALLIIATVVVLSPLVLSHVGVSSSTAPSAPSAASASEYAMQDRYDGYWSY